MMPASRSNPIEPNAVRFDEEQMWVDLEDGRTLGIPHVWFPRLLHSGSDLREKYLLSPDGLHCDELYEDISSAGQLARRGPQTQARSAAA